jgi:hypothetical protein
MSMKTWLGPDRQDWADHNRCDYASMADLCREAAWRLPAKVFSPSTDLIDEFLVAMRDDDMGPDDFASLEIWPPLTIPPKIPST